MRAWPFRLPTRLTAIPVADVGAERDTVPLVVRQVVTGLLLAVVEDIAVTDATWVVTPTPCHGLHEGVVPATFARRTR